MEQQPIQQKDNQEEKINLRQIFEQYAYYWKWFVLTIIISVGVATFYLRYAQKTYSTTAKILLKDERSGSAGELAGIAELTSSMGFGATRSAFVTDQIEVLTSRRLMRKVVQEHHLNIIYSVKGNIRSAEVLSANMPFIIHPNGDQDTVKLKIGVKFKEGKPLQVTNLVSGKSFTCNFDKVVEIGNNKIIFKKNTGILINKGEDFEVTVMPQDWAVDATLASINVVPNKETQSYIVNFSMISGLSKKSRVNFK